jgi:hypothetical protein
MGGADRLDQAEMSDEGAPDRRGGYERQSVLIMMRLEAPTLRASRARYEHLITEANPTGEWEQLMIEGPGISGGPPMTIGFIDRDGGTERYLGPLMIQIAGHGPQATMWYWANREDNSYVDGEGQLHFSIYVEDERMQWLWRHCIERPGSAVTFSCHADMYRMNVEAAFGDIGDRVHYYLPSDPDQREPRIELSQIELSVVSGPGATTAADEADRFDYDSSHPDSTPKPPDRPAIAPARRPWELQTIIVLLTLVLIELIFQH